MRRLFGNAIIMIAAFLLLSNCAFLQNLTGQYQLQTYTFNFNGDDYSVLLPKLVPMPAETAKVVPQAYWSVNMRHIIYAAGEQPEPDLPVLTVWFTKKLGVFGLVWHTLESDGTVKHTPWLIVKGLPIPTSVDDFDVFLQKLYNTIFNPEPDDSI